MNLRVRPRVVGAVCFACGVAAWVAFEVWTRPNDRVQMAFQAFFLICWFGVGLTLLAVPVIWRLPSVGEPNWARPRSRIPGCLLLMLGAFIALMMVVSVLGP